MTLAVIILLASSWPNALSLISAHADDSDNKIGIFDFKQIVMDGDGKKYLIGELSNPDIKNSIRSIVYFSKTSLESSYYSKDTGVISPGMGMPFKINLTSGVVLDPSDIKIVSYPTIQKPNDMLSVNYSSLVMDPKTHGITGILHNNSPFDSHNVKVLAIAMDAHSKYLDVTESGTIATIPSNGSAYFSLTPMSSIANSVSSYSCFVPSSSGLNFTLPADKGQKLQLEINSDGKIRNVKYDPLSHSVNFDAQGIFLGGGWAEVMFISGPDSFIKSPSVTVMLNGYNDTKARISNIEIASGQFYKHVDIQFPFGKNSISISDTSVIPEFPYPVFVAIASFGFVIILIVRKRTNNF